MEWVDNLFICMEQFYGDRWSHPLKNPLTESFYKTIWQSGLMGLTYDEIKKALLLCKRSALNPSISPPHVMEFFRYAKQESQPFIDYHPRANEKKQADKEIAMKHLADIRKKINTGSLTNNEIDKRSVW